MNKLKVFGDRVIVERVAKSTRSAGNIIIPVAAQKNELHAIGRVVRVGDGRWTSKPAVPMHVRVNDYVYFQVNESWAAMHSFEFDDKLLIALHQDDCLARVQDPDNITEETFHACGKWLILRPALKQATSIIVPEDVREPDMWQFHVVSKGENVRAEIEVGMEVMPVFTRAQPFQLYQDGQPKDFVYVEQDFIMAAVLDDHQASLL
jgi:co-chaperonin GroES (HSP10)